MEHNYSSAAMDSTVIRPPAFNVAWAKAGVSDSLMLYCSLILLLSSTVDNGPLGDMAKVCWLVSFACLCFMNIGAGFIAYIASLAIFSPLHFETMTSLLQRPDNLAVPILFAAMGIQIASRRRPLQAANPYMGVFCFFMLVHGLLFAPDHHAALFRNLIPFLACFLAAWIGFEEREVKGFEDGLIALGCYNGLVSILERTPLFDRVLPLWIGDPSLRPYDLYQEQWLGMGRSGGTLIQPAFNGLLLVMVLMILVLRLRRGVTPYYLAGISLCVAGAFFTYTRGVWLSMVLALVWFPGWCKTPRQAKIRRVSMVLIAVCFVSLAGGAARERIENGNNILFRFNLWGAAGRLITLHPIVGVGFFNFGTAMTTVQQGFGALQPKFRKVEAGIASHNTALTVLVEFGIPGLILYGLAFIRVVKNARINCYRLFGRSGAVWVLAFTSVYIVNSQFISCFEVTVNAIFFGVLGVLGGARVLTDSSEKHNSIVQITAQMRRNLI